MDADSIGIGCTKIFADYAADTLAARGYLEQCHAVVDAYMVLTSEFHHARSVPSISDIDSLRPAAVGSREGNTARIPCSVRPCGMYVVQSVITYQTSLSDGLLETHCP